MGERKVSLRVSAVGGDRLKAELRSIGAEGQHALSLLEGGWSGAGRGLHATGLAADALMERLTTLSMRAAQAANSMGAVEKAGPSMLSRINAATGVSTVGSRAAEDIAAYGRALDDVRAKLNPLFAEERRHAEAMAEIDRAYRTGAVSLAEWETATRREIAANERATASIRQREAALDNLVNTGLRDAIDRNTGVSGDRARSAEDVAAYGRALDETRAKYNPMFAAISRYRSEIAAVRAAHAAGSISADEMTAAIGRLRRASLQEIDVIKGRVRGYQAMEKQGGLARFQMAQLAYQLNDIGVSLASGQNPFVVLVQQGAQIAQTYAGQGGVRAALEQTVGLIGKIPGPLKAAGIGIGLGALAIAGLTNEIDEAQRVQVSFGDTALAAWQVFSEGVYSVVKPAIDFLVPYFDAAWDAIVAGVKWTGNAIINGIRVAVLGIGTAVEAIPAFFEGAFYKALAAVQSKMHDLVWWVSYAVNGIAGKMNEVFGTTFSTDNLSATISRLSEASGESARAGAAASAQSAAAWGAFGEEASAIMGSDPMGAAFDAIQKRAVRNALDRRKEEGGSAGGGGAGSKEKAAKEAEPTLTALQEIMKALQDYAAEAMNFGQAIGDALVGAFQSAEDAVMDFVETGKLDIASLATSIVSDFARVGLRAYIMGPLAQGLSSAIGGGFGQSLMSAFVQHEGGSAGSGPVRAVSAANFARAPRLHDGMGDLRADEYAAILQRGERVLNRSETRAYEAGGSQPVVVNFNGVRDAASFRQSRTQVAADLGRAVAMGRRGM